MEVYLYKRAAADRQQAVALEVFGKVIADYVFVQVLAIDEQLGVILVL